MSHSVADTGRPPLFTGKPTYSTQPRAVSAIMDAIHDFGWTRGQRCLQERVADCAIHFSATPFKKMVKPLPVKPLPKSKFSQAQGLGKRERLVDQGANLRLKQMGDWLQGDWLQAISLVKRPIIYLNPNGKQEG